jgi:hypothetical protein
MRNTSAAKNIGDAKRTPLRTIERDIESLPS